MKNSSKLVVCFIALVSSAFSQEGKDEKKEEKVGLETQFERLDLEKSFKGFSWETPSKQLDPKTFSVRLHPVDSDKRLTGMAFIFDKEKGELLSLSPIIENKDKFDDQLKVMLWAFNSFQEGNITFDSLWEVYTACVDGAVKIPHVFLALADGLSNYERKAIPIYKGGPVEKALINLKKSEFIKNNEFYLMDMVKSL